jgi:hypothetical protein
VAGLTIDSVDAGITACVAVSVAAATA